MYVTFDLKLTNNRNSDQRASNGGRLNLTTKFK